MTRFNFENKAHLDSLQEIHDMCFFGTTKESEAFWRKISEAGEFEDGVLVSQDSFELAHIAAKEILFNRGAALFRRPRRAGAFAKLFRA